MRPLTAYTSSSAGSAVAPSRYSRTIAACSRLRSHALLPLARHVPLRMPGARLCVLGLLLVERGRRALVHHLARLGVGHVRCRPSSAGCMSSMGAQPQSSATRWSGAGVAGGQTGGRSVCAPRRRGAGPGGNQVPTGESTPDQDHVSSFDFRFRAETQLFSWRMATRARAEKKWAKSVKVGRPRKLCRKSVKV